MASSTAFLKWRYHTINVAGLLQRSSVFMIHKEQNQPFLSPEFVLPDLILTAAFSAPRENPHIQDAFDGPVVKGHP
jgi:hypothetical protein